MVERPIRLLHLITSLSVGGAEEMLYKLLSKMDRQAFSPEVWSLTGVGPVGEKICRDSGSFQYSGGLFQQVPIVEIRPQPMHGVEYSGPALKRRMVSLRHRGHGTGFDIRPCGTRFPPGYLDSASRAGSIKRGDS